MADRAHIKSIEAIDHFRAALLIYIEKATQAVDAASHDIMRTRMWLDHDQRTHWEAQVRRRTKDLEMAQADLFSARSAGLPEATTVRQMEVNKAKRVLVAAEEKLIILKRWSREFEHEVSPQARHLENLHAFLTVDMQKAVHFLGEIHKILESYAYRERAPVIAEGLGTPASGEGVSTAAKPSGGAS
ncbi:MAG: hypothetical protein AB1705_01420 [Verrucomicrobiota bacterium]